MLRAHAATISILLTVSVIAMGCTGSGEEGLQETASVSVTGAQFASWTLDAENNYIHCLEGDDTLWVDVGKWAFSIDDQVSLSLEGYTGPGIYSWTYDSNYTVFRNVEVDIGGLYTYHAFYDYSRIDFHEVHSTCTVMIDEAPGGGLTGTIDCADLIAGILSSDYEDSPAEFQPRVDVFVSFTCAL